MIIIVAGRPFSGRKTFKQIVEAESNVEVKIVEDIEDAAWHMSEKHIFVAIDTPTLICYSRCPDKMLDFGRFSSKFGLERKEKLLYYVTELPKVTIIKNALTLEDFRVQIKNFLVSNSLQKRLESK